MPDHQNHIDLKRLRTTPETLKFDSGSRSTTPLLLTCDSSAYSTLTIYAISVSRRRKDRSVFRLIPRVIPPSKEFLTLILRSWASFATASSGAKHHTLVWCMPRSQALLLRSTTTAVEASTKSRGAPHMMLHLSTIRFKRLYRHFLSFLPVLSQYESTTRACMEPADRYRNLRFLVTGLSTISLKGSRHPNPQTSQKYEVHKVK